MVNALRYFITVWLPIQILIGVRTGTYTDLSWLFLKHNFNVKLWQKYLNKLFWQIFFPVHPVERCTKWAKVIFLYSWLDNCLWIKPLRRPSARILADGITTKGNESAMELFSRCSIAMVMYCIKIFDMFFKTTAYHLADSVTHHSLLKSSMNWLSFVLDFEYKCENVQVMN